MIGRIRDEQELFTGGSQAGGAKKRIWRPPGDNYGMMGISRSYSMNTLYPLELTKLDFVVLELRLGRWRSPIRQKDQQSAVGQSLTRIASSLTSYDPA